MTSITTRAARLWAMVLIPASIAFSTVAVSAQDVTGRWEAAAETDAELGFHVSIVLERKVIQYSARGTRVQMEKLPRGH